VDKENICFDKVKHYRCVL